MAPRDARRSATTCHNKGADAQWKGSMHDARNLSCVHLPFRAQPEGRARAAQGSLPSPTPAWRATKPRSPSCSALATCPSARARWKCSSCHNPHGSTNLKMLEDRQLRQRNVRELPHRETRAVPGDHAPVREACNTCHDPHGSNNERMLVAKLPMMRQRCHIGTKHPSTIYDAGQVAKGSSRIIGRGRVNCHSQIHGLNSPAGNTFLQVGPCPCECDAHSPSSRASCAGHRSSLRSLRPRRRSRPTRSRTTPNSRS